MNHGWVKLYRTARFDPLWQKQEALNLLLHIALSVSPVHTKALAGYQGISLKPGQMITSYSKLASETGMSKSRVVRVVKALENCGLIDTKSDTPKKRNFTVITLLKNDICEVCQMPEKTKSDTPPTQKRHTSDTEVEPLKEVRSKNTTPLTPLRGEASVAFEIWKNVRTEKKLVTVQDSKTVLGAKKINQMLARGDFTEEQFSFACKKFLSTRRVGEPDTLNALAGSVSSFLPREETRPANVVQMPSKEERASPEAVEAAMKKIREAGLMSKQKEVEA
jgi:DNA-binding transcriptional ArsR family regulator